ncbi:MAG: methylenetetrahydrofolate--tRNA-(uracil(54)-C(5))-methyltransferase (FADH(2)-oxidizing) TrmFO [Bellilinea sp.]
MKQITVIGGGLAGSEAAWQAAEMGCEVFLYEMRPDIQTGAHVSGYLAELVCSNSLGSNLIDRASGLLKEEIRRLGSLLLQCAEATALPAGGALAVDRHAFASMVTERIIHHPRIHLIREEVKTLPAGIVVIASGPLTSPALAESIQNFSGENRLFFYDAIAPIIDVNSIDFSIAFKASRYGIGEEQSGDYINCPLNRDEYFAFVEALRSAQRISLREFEKEVEAGVHAGMERFFEGCLPVEILAQRGDLALAYGPMRPVGLKDPRTGKRPFAVVQLRQDNLAGTLYNLVGFQTNLTFPEQKRVFRMIPGLQNAEFVRFGQMHRNTFIASPLLLKPSLQARQRENLLFAGQITGVEGYMGNIATGLLAGMNAARLAQGQPALTLPQTTMLGALCHYVTHASMKDFQPMKANFGILPELPEPIRGKRARAQAYAERSLRDLQNFFEESGIKTGITP